MISDKEISDLSVAERILLIEKIWDSLVANQLSVPPLQQEELDRRLERFKQGKTNFYSFEKIKNDLHSSN